MTESTVTEILFLSPHDPNLSGLKLNQLLPECIFSLHENEYYHQLQIHIVLCRQINCGKIFVIWNKNYFPSHFELFDHKVFKMLDFSPVFTANYQMYESNIL